MRKREYWKKVVCFMLATSIVMTGNGLSYGAMITYGEEASTVVSENSIVEMGETEEKAPVKLPSDDVADTALAKTVIQDSVLMQLIADTMEVDADALTVGQLKAYTGVIDTTTLGDDDAKSINSFVGLGYLQNASQFNLSNCVSVKSIAAQEFMECEMTSIVLPDSIEEMGDYAFFNCVMLEKVSSGENEDTLPSMLKNNKVGGNVFNNCSALKKIIISDADTLGGTSLEAAAGMFRNCKALQRIEIGKNITILPPDMLGDCGNDVETVIAFTDGSKLNKIAENAFSNSKIKIDLSSCTELKVIDKNAFNGSVLDSLDLSECAKLERFGDGAFKSSGIKKLILPDELASEGGKMYWGAEVFASTSGLTKLTIASEPVTTGIIVPHYVTVTEESTGIFKSSSINGIIIPGEWTCIPGEAFSGSSIVNLTINEETEAREITKIGDNAFYAALSMTNVDFLSECNKLKSIGSMAFCNCEKIADVHLMSSVETLGPWAFGAMQEQGNKYVFSSGITSFVWDSMEQPVTTSVERSIGVQAFAGCTLLTSVCLPENNNAKETFKIGSRAFENAISLEKIVAGSLEDQLPTRTTAVGELAFFKCNKLKSVYIRPDATMSPIELGEGIFAKCTGLEESELPANLTIIPDETYFATSLKSLKMGSDTVNTIKSNTLTRIGEFAFFGCEMPEVDLSGCPKLEQIDGWAFASLDTKKNCDRVSLEKGEQQGTYFKLSKIKSVIIPDKLEKFAINSGAFFGAIYFDTFVTASEKDMDGVVHIPEFCVGLIGKYGSGEMGIGEGTFAGTAIVPDEKTIPKSWTGELPVSAFDSCPYIQDLDFLKDTNISGLGDYCFADCIKLKNIDLKNNTSIKIIRDQCFKGCISLTSNEENPLTLPVNTESIGKYAFALGAYGQKPEANLKAENVIDSPNFLYVDLSDYEKLAEIKIGAFRYNNNLVTAKLPKNEKYSFVDSECFMENYALKNIDFGSAKEIRSKAFKSCYALNLKGTSLDLIEKIAMEAFMGDYSLTEVKFGPKLATIEQSAFKQCAELNMPSNGAATSTRSILETSPELVFDFSKAAKLATVGTSAFEESAVRTVNMEGASGLVDIPVNMFAGCSLLSKVSFDKELAYIAKNALSGCSSLQTVDVYSRTMVDSDAFKDKFLNNPSYVTNKGFALNVKPYQDIIKVPLGKTRDFPYYISINNTGSKSPYTYVVAGSKSSVISAAEKADMFLSVSGAINGYYANTYEESAEYIVPSEFIDKTPHETTTIVKNVKRKVHVFQVTGRKVATYPFRVGCSVDFSIGEDTKSISFFTDYKVSVTEEPYFASLYDGYNTSTKLYGDLVEPGKQAYQSDISNVKPVVYYKMGYADGTDSEAITDKNVIVVSDNPSVMYAGASASDRTAATTGIYSTKVAATSTNPADCKFTLIPVGVGTAKIKVYPSEYGPGTPNGESHAQTYEYTVSADVRGITINVPSEGRTLMPKQSTKLSLRIVNTLNQTTEISNLQELSKCTNNKIVLESKEPGLLTVDGTGLVTAIKAEERQKGVEIVAKATTSKNTEVIGRTTISVKPLEVKAGESFKDETSQAEYKVEKAGSATIPGEISYAGTTVNTATVNIPASVKVGAVTYKVVDIADNAFKNNTTLKTVYIPDTVKTIGKSAFSGCKALTKVTGGKNVVTIGNSAFSGCAKLPSITLYKNVQTIGKKVFYNCKKLKKITIKSKVLTKVGGSTFKNIYKKATIKSPKSVRDLLRKKGQAKTVKMR